MAIDAKVSFLRNAEGKLSSQITAADMQKVLATISDVLEGYDMRERAVWAEDEKDDMLDSFLTSMHISGRSELTIDRYERMIKKFLKQVMVPTRRINVYHVRKWLAEEKERGLMESSQEGERQILSSYFGWLTREGLIEKNPMNNIGPIKVPKKKKRVYSSVEMQKLYDACRKIRDKALISFLATTGCRVSEATGLNRDALDLKQQECVVYGKGDKERVVYFDSVTAMLLEEYLESRKDDCEALFAGKGGVRLQAQGVRDMLKRIADRAGVDNVHPHKFRRTKATEMARRGMPIQEIAHILGHEKLETTMEYVVQNREDVKSDYRRYA